MQDHKIRLCNCGCGKPRRPADERFWEKVREDGSGCWLWTGYLQGGYGKFRDGRDSHLAHVYAYRAVVGAIPDALELDHLCRVRACVNPAHLEAVTHAENIRRGWTARGKATHCRKGHPLTAANTYVNNGKRSCVICRTANNAAWDARRPPRPGRRKMPCPNPVCPQGYHWTANPVAVCASGIVDVAEAVPEETPA